MPLLICDAAASSCAVVLGNRGPRSFSELIDFEIHNGAVKGVNLKVESAARFWVHFVTAQIRKRSAKSGVFFSDLDFYSAGEHSTKARSTP